MVKLRSRKKTQFKKGHKGYPTRGCTPVENSLNDEMKKREYVRLTRDIQDMLDTVGATYANTASDADERHTPMVLRPRPARPSMLETAQTPATDDAEMETQSCQPRDAKKSTRWLQKEYFAIKKSTFHYRNYVLAI